MTQASQHFSVEELTRTNTGLPNECPVSLAGNLFRLAETLEQIRELLGCPIKINSGFRSEAVNQAAGGVRTSAHLYARAADFVPATAGLAQAFQAIRGSGIVFDQLILEPSWIHVGIAAQGETPRQQCLTAHREPSGMVYAHV